MISAVIITLNEEEIIADCLKALSEVVDDIVVIDAFSKDKTVEICQQFGANVIQKEWVNFSFNKNFGNKQAKNDWILSIDADEILSQELIETLKRIKPVEEKVYVLDRIANYNGKWIKHSGWYPDWKERLFNRNDVQWQGDFVHETLRIPTHFEKIQLQGKLFHYPYKDAEEHLEHVERYARLAAENLLNKGRKFNVFMLWVSPIARFIRTFFIKKGILDGKEGWIISKRNMHMVRLKYKVLRALNHKK